MEGAVLSIVSTEISHDFDPSPHARPHPLGRADPERSQGGHRPVRADDHRRRRLDAEDHHAGRHHPLLPGSSFDGLPELAATTRDDRARNSYEFAGAFIFVLIETVIEDKSSNIVPDCQLVIKPSLYEVPD